MDHLRYYEKQQLLGKGSFGEAYLVKSTLNHRFYVIKSLRMPSSNSSDGVSRYALKFGGRTAFQWLFYSSEGRKHAVDGGDKDSSSLQAHQCHQVQRLLHHLKHF